MQYIGKMFTTLQIAIKTLCPYTNLLIQNIALNSVSQP